MHAVTDLPTDTLLANSSKDPWDLEDVQSLQSIDSGGCNTRAVSLREL